MKHRLLGSLLITLALQAGALEAATAQGPDSSATGTALPDYAGNTERPLIDRLVHEGLFPREEATNLYPNDRAQRGDLAHWLAGAFGWREKKLSGAWIDLPDTTLEASVDGLARRRVLDVETRTSEYFHPFGALTLPTALLWCGNAVRAASKGAPPDSVLRQRLLANTSLANRAVSEGDTLTRAQALGMVANARFLNPRGKR